jgi:hypothetical protein
MESADVSTAAADLQIDCRKVFVYAKSEKFVKSLATVMPDPGLMNSGAGLSRNPELIEFTGFRLSPD